MPRHSATPPPVALAHDVYIPGHLGELTQVIDPQLVDAVLDETGSRERRVRSLPARGVVYFVLTLAFFERSSYPAVWDKLCAGLRGIAVARPCAARRRLGSAPLRRLFEILVGPVATRAQASSFHHGLRVVVVDGTTLSIPDEEAVTWRFPKHGGKCSSSAARSCVWWRWSSAAPAPSSARPSARTRPASSATRAACWDSWTPRWCAGRRLLRRVRLPGGGDRYRRVFPAALNPQAPPDGAPPAAGRLLSDDHLRR